MSGNLSPHVRLKLAALQAMTEKVQRAHGMVERFAATRDPRQAEMLVQPLKRTFGRLKLDLMGAGLDTISQLAGAMEIAAGRGGGHQQKIRILREGVGSLRFQMEHEQRKLVADDQARQATPDPADSRPQADPGAPPHPAD